ncbi:MAG TPA: peroxide stress protein YaaA [Desulfocapsa sulfexigens]|nr:peroxide stress protein YaaA [Desulfocapsa sulfexigens]
MLMIIAPSKTQDFNHSFTVNVTQPPLLQDSVLLIEELKKLSVSDLGKLMKMSDRLAVQTHERIQDFHTPFTAENAHPAIAVFQGDVYSGIAVDDYGKEELVYVQDRLRILSGLYGILRPLDLMQKYRLEMGCKLASKRGKNLYEFWGNKVTDELNLALKDQKEAVIVNLASAEYSRVIKKKNLQGSILQIDFKERKEDSYRTVAIHAKRARGMMVNFAVKNRLQTVTELKTFQEAGYSFQPEMSREDLYCFARE